MVAKAKNADAARGSFFYTYFDLAAEGHCAGHWSLVLGIGVGIDTGGCAIYLPGELK